MCAPLCMYVCKYVCMYVYVLILTVTQINLVVISSSSSSSSSLLLLLSVLLFENIKKRYSRNQQTYHNLYVSISVSDGIDIQESCTTSEQERKQSVAREGVAVSQEVKQVSTCEQKVTFCDEELPNIAAGQDRYKRFFCIVNFYILNPTI